VEIRATIERVNELGRILLIAGLLLAAAGAAIVLAFRAPARRIPGTVVLRGAHVTVFVPLLLCLIVSLILTVLIALLRR
jgi:hypothetical protein